MTGTPEFPLAQIPFAKILERMAAGFHQAEPAKLFPLQRIQDTYRVLEADGVGGKVVVTL